MLFTQIFISIQMIWLFFLFLSIPAFMSFKGLNSGTFVLRLISFCLSYLFMQAWFCDCANHDIDLYVLFCHIFLLFFIDWLHNRVQQKKGWANNSQTKRMLLENNLIVSVIFITLQLLSLFHLLHVRPLTIVGLRMAS